MAKMYVADPTAPVTHRLAELRHSVIDAPAAVFHSSVQGPVDFVRCACGWTASADEVNVYTAAKEHLGIDVR